MEILEDFQSNYKTGWVKLYRSIKNHWLLSKSRPLTELEAWIMILLEVNHSGKKLKIGYDIFECSPGESLNSLDTWSKIFNWNKSKVRRFFNLLQKDSMIELKNVKKTTHLKVCKWDTYQGERNESETIVKRKRNASETQVTPNKNVKNVNNEKKIAILDYSDIEISLWDTWTNYKKSQFKFTYKSEDSEQTALNHLIKISGNNNNTARLIINQSISNGWKGLFKLNNQEKEYKPPKLKELE